MARCFNERWRALDEITEMKEVYNTIFYKACEQMVKPWTRNTGNSVACS